MCFPQSLILSFFLGEKNRSCCFDQSCLDEPSKNAVSLLVCLTMTDMSDTTAQISHYLCTHVFNVCLCLCPGSESELSCVVSVVNQLDSVTLSNGFTYRSALTPVISEVSPRRGGTAGGTRLTISGSGFRCVEVNCSPAAKQRDDRQTDTERNISHMIPRLTLLSCCMKHFIALSLSRL